MIHHHLKSIVRKVINEFFFIFNVIRNTDTLFKLINNRTREMHRIIVAYAAPSLNPDKLHDDPDLSYSLEIRDNILKVYKNKYRKQLKVLIHRPSFRISPGGYSVFNNMLQTLNFMGVTARAFDENDDFPTLLSLFQPDIFITSDDKWYLEQIDWKALKNYKKENRIAVGLSASIQEYTGLALEPRLDWAKKNKIDFYYSFRAPEYINSRKSYNLYKIYNYTICSIEFGANILEFYPTPRTSSEIEFAFFGSINPAKQNRYVKYFPPILKNHCGLIDGPGWPFNPHIQLSQQKYAYALATVGLNLHLEEQIEWPCELNERTYILAACRIPQLIDNPALLLDRFSSTSLFVGKSPSEYYDQFRFMLENKTECIERSNNAYSEVLAKHTTFHRMDDFIHFSKKIFDALPA